MQEDDVAQLLEHVAEMEACAAAQRRFFLERKYVAIADFREAHGLSLAQLADVLGVSRPRAQQLVDEGKQVRQRTAADG